jgi:hypothetical protein
MTEDKIEHLAREMKKGHNIHKMMDHIKTLLVENRIITKPSVVHFKVAHPDNPSFIEAIAYVAPEQNIFNKQII